LKDFYKGKTIAVLGGAGFIGSNVAAGFVNAGAKVIVIDGFLKRTGADEKNIETVKEKIVLFRDSVETLPSLIDIMAAADMIIDAVAFTSHLEGIEDPVFDLDLNARSHLHIINALKGVGSGKKVIYLGSRGQYGKVQAMEITEDTPMLPADPQGINKMAAELFYKFYSQRYGFGVVSLRIPNTYGENQRVGGKDLGLVGGFINEVLAGKTVELYGSGKRKKNFLYVGDIVDIILRIGAIDFKGFDAYNIAGVEISLDEFLKAIIRIAGKGSCVVREFPSEVRQIDVGEARFSDEKLRKTLGGITYAGIEKSIERTIEYFKTRQG
jgi:nucleoside-diphosphate-sugar epimerase